MKEKILGKWSWVTRDEEPINLIIGGEVYTIKELTDNKLVLEEILEDSTGTTKYTYCLSK